MTEVTMLEMKHLVMDGLTSMRTICTGPQQHVIVSRSNIINDTKTKEEQEKSDDETNVERVAPSPIVRIQT